MSFRSTFHHLANQHSPLCVGIDPSSDQLRRWNLSDDVSGLEIYSERYLDFIADEITLVKPQVAYFERFGAAGLAVLERLIAAFRARGVLVLVDAKRGDIGPTMNGYAQAYFSAQSPLRTDGLTVNAFLGLSAALPIIEAADRQDGHVFIVVASSNPEGIELQSAQLGDGLTLSERLGRELTAINARFDDGGPVGAVVGATRRDLTDAWWASLDNTLVLAPGVGEQGATIDDLQRRPNPRNIIPTVSRAISNAGPQRQAFRDAVDRLRTDAFNLVR